jgi:hypothetical protein
VTFTNYVTRIFEIFMTCFRIQSGFYFEHKKINFFFHPGDLVSTTGHSFPSRLYFKKLNLELDIGLILLQGKLYKQFVHIILKNLSITSIFNWTPSLEPSSKLKRKYLKFSFYFLGTWSKSTAFYNQKFLLDYLDIQFTPTICTSQELIIRNPIHLFMQ